VRETRFPRTSGRLKRVLETGEPVLDWQCRFERPDGDRRWLSISAAPLGETNGEPEQIVVAGEDITHHKQRARRLERERERELAQYETVVETIADGVYALDDQYRFTLVNEGYTEMTDYDREELLSSHITTVVDEDALADGEERREALLAGEDDTDSVELEIETADGERLTVESRHESLPSDNGFQGTAGVVRDVTERKRHESGLSRYETLFEESKDVNVIVEPDGTFRYLTPSASSVFGYDPEELVGEMGFEYIHPDDRDEAMAEFAKIVETPSYEPRMDFRFRTQRRLVDRPQKCSLGTSGTTRR